MSKSLGLSAGKRPIGTGKQYDHLFGVPSFSDPVIKADGSVDDTIKVMASIAGNHKAETAKIAELMHGRTIEYTCRNVWEFVFHNIQYSPDKLGVEQVRTPNRTWNDRKFGVDCDCMATFVSSILRNLDIPHRFRVTKYSDGDWEHVYIVVPRNGKNLLEGQIIIDTVLHQFNSEKDYYQAQDYDMAGKKLQLLNGIPIQTLNGLGAASETHHNSDQLNQKLHLFLQEQLEQILRNRREVTKLNPAQAIDNITYMLDAWHNEHDRYTAAQNLARLEQNYNPETYMFRSILAFFDGNATCADVCSNGYVQLTTDTLVKIHSSIDGITNDKYGDPIVMRTTEHNINRVALAAARGAFLTLVRLNFANLATKIASGFFPANTCGENYDAQWFSERTGSDRSRFASYNYSGSYSRAFGLTASDHLNNRRNLYDKILRRWYNLGGDWDNLKQTALNGAWKKMLNRAAGLPGFEYWCKYDDHNLSASSGTNASSSSSYTLNGISGLGSAAVATAVISAASTIIVALLEFLKATKLPSNAISDPYNFDGSYNTPTSNPDPINHPDAHLETSTGMWTDTSSGEIYDLTTKTWIGASVTPGTSNSDGLKKLGLTMLGIVGIGAGLFSLMGNENTKNKKNE